jgi:hypothetical protein|nr:MAG TPA: maltose-binding periplasmic protein [Caudoviricetes sp.]
MTPMKKEFYRALFVIVAFGIFCLGLGGLATLFEDSVLMQTWSMCTYVLIWAWMVNSFFIWVDLGEE